MRTKSAFFRGVMLLLALSLLFHAASAARIRQSRTLEDTPPCPRCEAYTEMVQNQHRPARWFCKSCGRESEVRQWARNPSLSP